MKCCIYLIFKIHLNKIIISAWIIKNSSTKKSTKNKKKRSRKNSCYPVWNRYTSHVLSILYFIPFWFCGWKIPFPECDRLTQYERSPEKSWRSTEKMTSWLIRFENKIKRNSWKNRMLHPWTEQRCLALYRSRSKHVASAADGWMEAERGSEVTLRGLRR